MSVGLCMNCYSMDNSGYIETHNLHKLAKRSTINVQMAHQIDIVCGVFTTDPGDWGSIPKTQKMVFDASLLNT